MHRRRTVITILLVSLVPAFLLTRVVVASYRASRQELARTWAGRGNRDLQSNRPAAAVEDFRTALSYSADDPTDRLRLAQALVASNRAPEAEAHLLTLWNDEPGNGQVNLELAQLAAKRGDVASAVRYYHAAIDGAWPSNPGQMRRLARFEVARTLIAAKRLQEAQAELTALGDEVGNDSGQLTEVGELLENTGADARALAMFQQALAIAPDNTRAAALGGDIAYRAGDYDTARRYLERAAAEAPLPPALEDELKVSVRVIRLDPFARGITLRERAERTMAIFQIARKLLESCQDGAAAQSGAVQNLTAAVERLAPRLGRRSAERDDDLADDALDTAFRIEALPATVCGPRSVDDRAVALLARERQ